MTATISCRRCGTVTLLTALLLAPVALTHADCTITIDDTPTGQTMSFIGATEAGGFWVEDLTDLGINTFRLWIKMAELEWWDDDDAVDGQ